MEPVFYEAPVMGSNNLFRHGLGSVITSQSNPFVGLIQPPAPPLTLADLAYILYPDPVPASAYKRMAGGTLLSDALDALARQERRDAWNAKFAHWERPASSSEESSLDRAQRMVRDAISDAVWLGVQNATVEPQGSYYNHTNTRRDADVDLRVQLPIIKVDYNPNVHVPAQYEAGHYVGTGWTHEQLFAMMRWEIGDCLRAAFGKGNVVPGKKAFEVKGVLNSRAKVDVVPALTYHHVWWCSTEGRFVTTEGVAILSTDGKWIYNYPEQHRANGIAKRANTGHQFKKVARIFKRLRPELAALGMAGADAASFLVESMVYNVEDGFFTVAGDDRLDRTRRVAQRLQWMIRDEPTAALMVEANGIKRLFTKEQSWTWAQASAFADSVVALLGDA